MPTPRRRPAKRPTVQESARRADERAAKPEAHATSIAAQKLRRFFGRIPSAVDVGAIALVIVALVLFAVVRPGCVGLGTAGSETTQETGYVSPYDWANLDTENGRFSYYENGELSSELGIDVSDHQGSIDWNAVAQDGIDFAFVRIGYRGYSDGGLFADENYTVNADGAADAGLKVGVYFFSQATSIDEAVEEADFVLQLLAGRYLDLPVVFDHEPIVEGGRANNVPAETVSACAEAFCKRIEEGGYSTMIYGNATDVARYDESLLDERPVWFAEYDVAAPTAQFDFSVWQYSNSGTVAGVDTPVDMNILFLNAPQPVE